MLKIGCHLSSVGGYFSMGATAVDIGSNTFQFFTRSPRGGNSKGINVADMMQFVDFSKENNMAKIVAHAPYTMNPCSSKDFTRRLARTLMREDLERMNNIPGNYYNMHPGSHTGVGVEKGIEYIAKFLNDVLTPENTTTILLETMAGKGSEIGSKFSELKAIIDRVHLQNQVGVCMDTCHSNDAGYNLTDGLDETLEEFDRIIGLQRLHAIHLNDSLNQRGSHKDRHALIGEGTLGAEYILDIVNHPKLRDKIFILETPTDTRGHAIEIQLLKQGYR